jgi:predicted unusual protein kinase regulating ubiquinone biosynthesis (AarF/ABC1/UbiB family)
VTTDVVALLDEWAARFFEELDYVREGQNATRFAAQMAKDLPQVRGDACGECLVSKDLPQVRGDACGVGSV